MTNADELSQEAAPRSSEEVAHRFVAAAPLADVPPGRVVAVRVEGRSIALVNDGGVIHALDGDCSHAGGPLGEGRTAGCLIACPWHGAVFDARTGAPARGPARKPVATHPVRVDGDTVLVAVDGPGPAGGDDEAGSAGPGDPDPDGEPFA